MNLNKIGKLNVPLSVAAEQLAVSKANTKTHTKAPNWDSAEDSIELIWFQNKSELDAMRRLQQDMLDNIQNQKAINAVHIRQAHKELADLRRTFIATNYFFKDCEEKCKMAEKKIDEETAKHGKLSTNIEKTGESIVELGEFRQTLNRTVADMEPYERVLQEVVDVAPDFKSIDECMLVGDSLMIAQVEIQALKIQKLSEIMDMHNRMKEMTKEAALRVLGLKNNLADLERSYAEACNECKWWEKVLDRGRRFLDENGVNKGRVLDGLHQLYGIFCNRNRIVGRVSRHNVETVLDHIKEEIELLRNVVDEYEGQTKGKRTERCL